MLPIPTLKGEIITLIPLQAHHFDALFLVASDPEIWEQHPDRFRYQKAVFQKYFDGAIASNGAYVIYNEQDEAIGCSRYYDIELPEKLTIGYTFLAKKYWGGCYNQALKDLMIAHAFKFVKEVQFHVGLENKRSQKALEKIGAIHVATQQMIYANETPQDHLIYSIYNLK